MAITVTRQNVDTWKKRIQRHDLKGSLYFQQQGQEVNVVASGDYQAMCRSVLGEDAGNSSLASYLRWDNVSAFLIVELIYLADNYYGEGVAA